MTKSVVLCNYFFVYKRTCLSFAGFKHLALLCQQGNDIVVFQPASEYLPLINKVFFSHLDKGDGFVPLNNIDNGLHFSQNLCGSDLGMPPGTCHCL